MIVFTVSGGGLLVTDGRRRGQTSGVGPVHGTAIPPLGDLVVFSRPGDVYRLDRAAGGAAPGAARRLTPPGSRAGAAGLPRETVC